MKRILFVAALFSTVAAAPAVAQLPVKRVLVEPYVGYGFYGTLPETNARLEGGVAYGGRASLRLTPQWAVFGDFRRSRPEVLGQLPFGLRVSGDRITVDHWSAGVEFSYAPRGGAEGMLPVILEAGLGQARYEDGPTDLAANLGISSALPLSPNLSIRYGVNDYVSSFHGDRGIVNQIFATVGAELAF